MSQVISEAATASVRKLAVRRRQPDIIYSAASIGTLLLAWYVASHSGLFRPGYVPTPESLVAALVDLMQNGYQGQPLSQHIAISLYRTLCGFVLGVIVGVPAGLLAGSFHTRPFAKSMLSLRQSVSTV